MMGWEKRLVEWLDRHKTGVFLVVVSILAMVLRASGKNFESGDYQIFLEGWFEKIRSMGGLKGLDEQVGNYNVVYQIIIALLTCLPFNPLYMYKTVSVFFDYVLAFAVGWLVCDLNGRDRRCFALPYSMVLILPTCFLNSSVWAQCDSIYVSFAVFCIIFMLRERYALALAFFGLSFAMKLQAVFIVPFILCEYAIRRKFSALLALIPLGINILPCVLCGRHPLDTFFIYLGQARQYRHMTLNFSSFWGLFPDEYYPLGRIALLVTIVLLGMELLILLRKKSAFESGEQRLYVLIWSAWTCLVFLPSMHERYGYIIEILLLTAAVVNHRMFPFAVLVQLVGIVRCSSFLWDGAVSDQLGVWLTVPYIAAYAWFTMLEIRRVSEAPEPVQTSVP